MMLPACSTTLSRVELLKVSDLTDSTHLRPDLIDNTLDDNARCRKCPLDNALKLLSPCHHRGALRHLPPELVHMVLSQLDIKTLTKFRCVDLQAREVVDTMPEYQNLMIQTPNLIRGVLSLNLAQ